MPSSMNTASKQPPSTRWFFCDDFTDSVPVLRRYVAGIRQGLYIHDIH